jgi:hypothetical protein
MGDMDNPDVRFGLERIKKNLIQLQDHATSYPCEACIKKHLLSVEVYAEEILPMLKDERMKEQMKAILEWTWRKRAELGDL